MSTSYHSAKEPESEYYHLAPVSSFGVRVYAVLIGWWTELPHMHTSIPIPSRA